MQKQLLGASLLLIIGLVGRLVPHPPNFTPVEAVALFGGAWLSPFWLSLLVPLGVMAISDLILGWHNLWPFTWGGMLIGTYLGHYVMQTHRWVSVAGTATLQATLFFLLTNFGVWIGGYYGHTFTGLITCYVAAIPFYHYQVLGALSYSTLFWAAEHSLFRRLMPARR
ncbi:MAG: hypothetical protein N3E49_00150 [Bacteroidia bacterium]|nr:hypothetical protein [Bacteroidia bacterium]